MDYTGLCLVVVGLVISTYSVNAQVCEDTLTKDNQYRVFDNNGEIIAYVDTCAELFKKYPYLCELTAEDKMPWEVTTGGPGGVCCKACGDPSCLDKLTADNTMSVAGKEVSDCSELATKYQVKCKFEGKPGGRCCQACKGVDITCVDQLRTFSSGFMCPGHVALDPCLCEDATMQRDCCATCAKYDNGCGNCKDKLDDSDPAKIEIDETIGGETFKFSKDIDNCEEIRDYFPKFCDEGSFGGPVGKCCKSCQGVDTTCTDRIAWRATVKKGKKKCENCTCHEIRKKSKKLMKIACKKRIKGNNSKMNVRVACCQQCKRLGFKA